MGTRDRLGMGTRDRLGMGTRDVHVLLRFPSSPDELTVRLTRFTHLDKF